jgi:hypothetical protein
MQWHERIKSRVKPRELHTLEAVVQLGSMAKAAAVRFCAAIGG